MELSKEYLKMKTRLAKQAKPAIEPNVQMKELTRGPHTLKTVTIEGTFPEVKTGRMYQTGRGRGTNIKAAAANAMRDLLKQPGLKAQRFTACKATISFGTVTVEES